MDIAKNRSEPEQLNRRTLFALMIRRSLFAGVAALAGGLAVKRMTVRTVAASVLTGETETLNNKEACNCQVTSNQCGCAVPPPPR